MTRPAVLCLIALGLASCDQSATRVSTLWTNVPEMASYVEKFNASQRDWQLLVEYKASPASELTTPGTKADLVVAKGLTASAIKDTLVPLDFLFDTGSLSKASFYRRVLDAGTQGEKVKALPVSVDLPVLELATAPTPDLPGFSLDLGTLESLNRKFTASPGAAARRMAFSPRWESFGLTILAIEGANFQEGFQGGLSWDSARLTAGLARYSGWAGPPWDQVTDFRNKYLQSAPGPALTSGRIQFYPSTLASFLSQPWEDRRGLDFRFVAQGSRVTANDEVIWAAIPSSSLTRGAAERFLQWFFNADNQKKLMVQGHAEDSRTFGLAAGLSALVEANSVLPDLYPELVGRLPAPDQVAFWGPLPPDWPALRDTVLAPWLETPNGTEGTLNARLEKHRAQASRN